MTPPIALTAEPARAERLLRADAPATARTAQPRTPRHLSASVDHAAALTVLIDGALQNGVEFLSLQLSGDAARFAGWLQAEGLGLSTRGVRVRVLNNTGTDVATRALLIALSQVPQSAGFATRLTLTLAIGYDTKRDIAAAAAACARENREVPTAAELEQHMAARDLPPIDLVLHADGRRRLSAFLLWHAAYAELSFLPSPWSAVTLGELRGALSQFASRSRTFGAVPAR